MGVVEDSAAYAMMKTGKDSKKERARLEILIAEMEKNQSLNAPRFELPKKKTLPKREVEKKITRHQKEIGWHHSGINNSLENFQISSKNQRKLQVF